MCLASPKPKADSTSFTTGKQRLGGDYAITEDALLENNQIPNPETQSKY